MTKNEAKKLLENNNIFIEKNYIKINNEFYDKKLYYSLSANFILSKYENKYFNKRKINMRLELIYALFLMNVSEFMYYGIILPLIVFLLNALISFSLGLFLQNSANFGLDLNFVKIGILMYFLALVFLLCFVCMFVSGILLKNYCFYAQINSYPRYYHISNKKFSDICMRIEEEIQAKSLLFSTIESDRLEICELKTTDYRQYFDILRDEDVHKYLFSKPFNSEKDAYTNIQSEINNYFCGYFNKLAIKTKENNELIGYIGLSKMDLSRKTCQIVYALGKKYWSKGYMSEAVKTFLEKLKEMGYEIILVGHIKENEKSKNVINKCGFIRIPSKDYTITRENVQYQIISYIFPLDSNGEYNE